jgi:hypothetical protein
MVWWISIFLAASGLVASAAVHVVALCGVDVQSRWPSIWLLHILLFLPMIGAIVTSKAADRRLGKSESFAFQPRWMRLTMYIAFVYGAFNFIYFGIREDGTPTHDQEGTYSLRNHGRLIRTISEQEYHAQWALHARGMSGHWMLFNFLAIGILVSTRSRLAQRPRGRRAVRVEITDSPP